MNRRSIQYFWLLAVYALLINPLSTSATANSSSHSDPSRPIVMEVTPSAPAGPETLAGMEGVYINEVLFHPDEGENEWVELKNGSHSAIDLDGAFLYEEDGGRIDINPALPPVPPGGFVLLVMDGMGNAADDTDFSDGIATLHSPAGVVDIFDDEAGIAALYKTGGQAVYLPMIVAGISSHQAVPAPESRNAQPAAPLPWSAGHVLSLVAWGTEPLEKANPAYSQGLWHPYWYVDLYRGSGANISQSPSIPGDSIGLLPDGKDDSLLNWYYYPATESSPAAENPVPSIYWFIPGDGATIDGNTFAVSWNSLNSAQGYRFQMDDSPDFSSPYTDTVLSSPGFLPGTTVPDGTYTWRVKVLSAEGESPWSPGIAVTSAVLPAEADIDSPQLVGSDYEVLSLKLLKVAWQLQHKDTHMLNFDIDGDLTGTRRWDSAHEKDGDWVVGNGEAVISGVIDRYYCTRASISMIASYFGGHLSQDRIAYELFNDTRDSVKKGPEGDLGAFSGTNKWADRTFLAWALGIAPEDLFYFSEEPTFAQVQAWLDASRPIFSQHSWVIESQSELFGVRFAAHNRVIDGYMRVRKTGETGILEFVHLLDPATRPMWILYKDANNDSGLVAPASAPNVRSDEDENGNGIPDTIDDSDGDGVCDFDERYRGKGVLYSLDYLNPDSDGDLITDKLDMLEYHFNDSGSAKNGFPDFDEDGDRKETDPDNDHFDNSGSIDGCEDANRDGRIGEYETSNLDPAEERECPPPLETVLIPGGTFSMGCDEDTFGDECGGDELPLHSVLLSPYRITKYEITNAQYHECEQAGACSPPAMDGSFSRYSYHTNPVFANYPVIQVSWSQANTFCKWAGMRLPSEAQWEMAARGAGDTREYPWGNSPPTCSTANHSAECSGDTAEVGTYPSDVSPWGVMDLGGNVNEWINDWHAFDYYASSPTSDPPGPDTGTRRVVRGGCFLCSTSRLAARSPGALPEVQLDNLGFRCVR